MRLGERVARKVREPIYQMWIEAANYNRPLLINTIEKVVRERKAKGLEITPQNILDKLYEVVDDKDRPSCSIINY